MSRRILLVVTAMLAAMSTAAVHAAPPVPKDNTADMQLLLATIRQNRRALVGVNLNLSAEEAAKFWPLYDKYQKEVNATGDRAAAVIEDYTANYRTLSNEKALQLLNDYLAAEATAFLGFVLGRTTARVANRPADGVLGDDALRPEQWMAAAVTLGLPLAPLHLRSEGRTPVPADTQAVEIAAGQAFGTGPRHAAAALATTLGLDYVSLVFDGEGRLLALSTQTEPGLRARAALAAHLGARP